MKSPVKRRNPQKSKKIILDCATELFSKKGYSRTSMDELADLCDLNKAMIFYYYDSKRGLYEAVIVKVLDEIYDTIVKENENHKTPLQELDSFIKTYASFASSHPYLPALLLKELSDSGSQIPQTLFAHMKKLYILFIDIMSRGVQKGCFNDVIPMIVYFMILGTLNLMVTTKPIRVKAQEMDEIDTCSHCDTDLISHYVFKKIEKMLKKEEDKQC
jgi:AcrR family transcriptional regulator